MKGKVLGSVQPAYLAWLPFFERMKVADVFIYLDDVEYSKNSFHNRNCIKTPQGVHILTVPILYKGNSKAFISQIKIDYSQKWQDKHWKTIQHCYRKAKYFDDLSPGIFNILMRPWESLADLTVEFLDFFRGYLGIQTPCFRSSMVAVQGAANEKLVNLCKYFSADYFIVKPSTEEYHPASAFKDHGIEFQFFVAYNKIYPQLYGKFLPGLSILDYAMNCGPNSF